MKNPLKCVVLRAVNKWCTYIFHGILRVISWYFNGHWMVIKVPFNVCAVMNSGSINGCIEISALLVIRWYLCYDYAKDILEPESLLMIMRCWHQGTLIIALARGDDMKVYKVCPSNATPSMMALSFLSHQCTHSFILNLIISSYPHDYIAANPHNSIIWPDGDLSVCQGHSSVLANKRSDLILSKIYDAWMYHVGTNRVILIILGFHRHKLHIVRAVLCNGCNHTTTMWLCVLFVSRNIWLRYGFSNHVFWGSYQTKYLGWN